MKSASIKTDKSLLLDVYDLSHWVSLNGKITQEEFCNHFVPEGIRRDLAINKWNRCLEYLRQDLGVNVRRDRYFNIRFDAWNVKNHISDILDEISLTEDPDKPESEI